jgi:sarcosine oxidase
VDGVVARRTDLLVVGGGVFGLSTAWEAAKRGRTVRLVDRSVFPTPDGASIGPSRKLRSTYPNPGYTRLVLEAIPAWRELEQASGEEILLSLGNVAYSVSDDHPTLDAFMAAGEAAGSRIERLGRDELRRRFPTFRLARSATFEPDAGLLRATAGTGAIRSQAIAAGVEVLEGVGVEQLDLEGETPAVVLADGRRYEGTEVVVAAGVWTWQLVPALRPVITMKCQGLAYLPEVPDTFDDTAFPPFSEVETTFYGFPRVGDSAMKIGWHPYGEVTDDPESPRDTASQPFVDAIRGFLGEHFGLDVPDEAIDRATCLYDITPAGDPVIDRLPGRPDVLVATGGSGHCYKFGPVMGRVIMDRLDGTPGGRWLDIFRWPDAAVVAA